MQVQITHTDNFYQRGQKYEIKVDPVKKFPGGDPKPLIKWLCYVVDTEELTLIDIRHAKVL